MCVCGGGGGGGGLVVIGLFNPEVQGTPLVDEHCPFFVFYLRPPPSVHPAVNGYPWRKLAMGTK